MDYKNKLLETQNMVMEQVLAQQAKSPPNPGPLGSVQPIGTLIPVKPKALEFIDSMIWKDQVAGRAPRDIWLTREEMDDIGHYLCYPILDGADYNGYRLRMVQPLPDSSIELNPGFNLDKFIEPRCSHTWQSYVGITQRYDFCTKCDKKRF